MHSQVWGDEGATVVVENTSEWELDLEEYAIVRFNR